MKADVTMPKLGESITEGVIVKWWKKPGDYVKKDETLLEISTDKVDSEIPSPYEGVVVELKAQENETVEVDRVIAVIDTAAEAGQEASPSTAAPAEEEPASAGQEEETETAAAAAAPSEGGDGGLFEVEMPRLGEGITEGTVVKWWKKVGDTVKKDETLLEISTDKVDSEIPSPYEGTLTEILVEEGETVEVGKVIAKISSKAAGAAGERPSRPESQPSRETEPRETAKVTNGGVAAPERSGETAATGTVPRQDGQRFYSPLVRSIARKEGISKEELATIPGTGLAGRVTKHDILNYIQSGRVAPAPQPEAPAAPPRPAAPAAAPVQAPMPSTEEVAAKYEGRRVEVVPMDNIRKRIAEHMVKSKHTSPHVYGVAEVDFTNAMNLVAKHRDEWKKRENMKLTVNPLILYCVAKAVQDFPDINASVEGQNVVKYKYLNIGMAVATERGLIVPVLKNADEMNFRGIARNAYDLAIRTRDRKLKPDEVQGATITVTNYGVFGNVIGFPIINQPNVAILGVGAIKKRPVVLETEHGDIIAIRQICYLTLSYDHRIVDGELGDRFLQQVRHYIENFEEGWL